MLNLNDIFLTLGRPITDKTLIDIFINEKIDVRNEVALESGLFVAYMEKISEGIACTFTDEAMFLHKVAQSVGQGPLYFSGVFFYAEGKDGYSGYRGGLPENLDFRMDRQEILRLLGDATHNGCAGVKLC